MDKGTDERVDEDLEAGTDAFNAMMAEDQIGRDQSSLHRGGLVGKQRKHVEKEPKSHRTARILLPTGTSGQMPCGARFRAPSTTKCSNPLIFSADPGPYR